MGLQPPVQALFDPGTVLAKQNLMSLNVAKFAGTGEEVLFHPWKNTLQAHLAALPVTPIETISILRNNTAGAALATVNTFHAAAGADPAGAVARIWQALESRFGAPARVAAAIRRQLDGVPPVRLGAECGPSLRRLHDACAVVLAHLPGNSNLIILNHPEGQQTTVAKLPDSLFGRW